MEIYNETVTDLLVDSWKRKPLEVRETINVSGLDPLVLFRFPSHTGRTRLLFFYMYILLLSNVRMGQV